MQFDANHFRITYMANSHDESLPNKKSHCLPMHGHYILCSRSSAGDTHSVSLQGLLNHRHSKLHSLEGLWLVELIFQDYL